jgi:hypothetical protein
MSKNRTELIHRALRNLGSLPQGMTPSDEEYDSVNDLIDPMVAELNQRNIIYIADIDNINDAHFLPLGHVLAGAARSEFGSLGTADATELAALAEQAELKLKEMDRNNITYLHARTMRSDYPVRRTVPTST